MLANNLAGSYSVDQIKLPKITQKMNKDYKFPYMEKCDPNAIKYNSLKVIKEENEYMNRSFEMKKKRLDWDEFKELSSYQIFTILTLNKVNIYLN